jgi:alkanesulfonate monooxygenase SsuD/methylene tetrahydromethanopterin reductase-like flavin-dependent oxidoreductase (luciferase family)
MGSVLARETNGQDVAIIQLGSTLPSTTPPTRIAEEYAMLDCISGGRLVAGFPTGLPTDATISNGVVPVEQRERFREALALVTKAWSAKEIFAWNGRHYQLGMVNLWPRPIQQPHPPIWIPGSGISSTADYVVGLDHCFCHLSYYGAKNAAQVGDRYWELVASKGRDDNPYRFSFLQLIGVAETDAEAEDLYAAHAEYFFHKLLYTPSYYQAIPGCLEYPALVQALENNPRAAIKLRELKAKDFYDRGFVIVGSPRTVREQLMEGVKRLRVGHLLALLHFGSMPTELCKSNIELFARSVLPYLEDLWDDAYEDRWWPDRLRAKRPVAAVAAAS